MKEEGRVRARQRQRQIKLEADGYNDRDRKTDELRVRETLGDKERDCMFIRCEDRERQRDKESYTERGVK